MTGVFAPQHHQNTNLFTSAVNNPQYHSHQTGAHPWSASSSPSTMDSGPSHAVGYNVERSFHPSSSSSAAAMAGPSTNTMISKDEDEGMATSLAFCTCTRARNTFALPAATGFLVISFRTQLPSIHHGGRRSD